MIDRRFMPVRVGKYKDYKMVKYCKQCAWHVPSIVGWDIPHIKCTNPLVNKKAPDILADNTINGIPCVTERRKTGWFSACGIKGKQFKAMLIID